jgi:hypothetical protein
MYGLVSQRHFRKLHPWVVRLRSAVTGLNADIAAGNRGEALRSLEDVSFWEGRIICDLIGADVSLAGAAEARQDAIEAFGEAAQATERARQFLGGDNYGLTGGTKYDIAQVGIQTGTQAVISAAGAAGSVAAISGTSGAAVTGSSAVVANLLSAAGATAAVPYAGWIVAAAAVTAAAIIATISVAKTRRLRQSEMAELGRRMGFPEAALIADFLIDALNWGPHQLDYMASKIEKKIAKGRSRKLHIERVKLSALGVIKALGIADARRAAGIPAYPPTQGQIQAVANLTQNVQAQIKHERRERQRIIWLIGGTTAVAALILILRR